MSAVGERAVSSQVVSHLAAIDRRRTWLTVLCLALGMLFIGLYVHLRFSHAVGELTYFKAAYDEDTYYNQALMDRTSVFYRLLSDHVLEAFAHGGWGHGLVLVLLDALLPVAAALAAYLLAGLVARRPSVRALLSLLLVFAPDLLSMGVSSIWDGQWNPSYLRSLIPHGDVLVPDYSTSYLGVLRSPEPQWAWTLLFLHWWLGLRLLGEAQQGRAGATGWWTGLLAVNVTFAFSYVFVALPAFLLAVAVVPVLLAKRVPARWFGAWVLTLALPALLVLAYLVTQPMAAGGASLVFASRLPVITPAAVLALLLSVAWALRFMRVRRIDLVDAYAALAGALPLALLNQQLVTGIMVSTRDWERYANYPLLMLSAIWLLRSLAPTEPAGHRFMRHLPAVCVALVVWTVLPAARDTYQQWYGTNDESLAIARALEKVPAQYQALPIVLEKVGLATLIQTRLDRGEYIGAYAGLFFNPVPDLRERPLKQHLDALSQKHQLYEYLFRTGVTPARLERALQAEASARSGYHLAFFFSFADHWYPATDNRRVREREIREAIPLIVEEYSALRERVPDSWRKPVLHVARKPLEAGGVYEVERLSAQPLAQGEVIVHLQRFRGTP